MNATHWHATTSVPGPVDPHGCCADQPTATSIAAGLRAEQETDAAVRLADGLRGGPRLSRALNGSDCYCEPGYECLDCGRRRIARRKEADK